MTSRDFCFWLQGYFEISNANTIGPNEAQCIRQHLAMVFKHEIDPSMTAPPGAPVSNLDYQTLLNDLHGNNDTVGALSNSGVKIRC